MKKFLFLILATFPILEVCGQTKEKGYYNTTQINILMGMKQQSPYFNPYYHYPLLSSSYIYPYPNFYAKRNQLQTTPSLAMTNGYIFNNHWAIGVGLGVELFNKTLFPLFADVRYSLCGKVVSPFFALKTGYGFGSFKKKRYDFDNLYLADEQIMVYHAKVKNKGGIMVHPEVGVSIPLNENTNLLFSVAYRYQEIELLVLQWYDNIQYPLYQSKWNFKTRFNSLSFGVAIMFK